MPRHKKTLAGGVAADDQGIFLCPPLRWLLRPPKKSSVAISQHVLKDIEAAVLAGYWSDVLHRHLECTHRTTSPATLLQVHQGNVQLLVVFLFILFSLEGALRSHQTHWRTPASRHQNRKARLGR